MSVSATYSEPARPTHGIETGKLLVLIWLATVATYLLASFARGTDMSTDDAMRLTEVRDFLAGQGWFDLTQYRLSPPGGVPMHWSRLVDVPLAALIRIGETLLPTALAERVATVVWPAALLLVLLIGVARLARELAGEAAARLALIFAALMAPVLQHFRPGAIDHHNLQLVLLVWSLALAARAQASFSSRIFCGKPASTPDQVRGRLFPENAPARARDLALAGVLSALSLAIGVEMAPAIAALGGAVALRWIVCGEAARPATTAFALAFAAATLALFAATVPPARYAAAACDALSIVHVTAAAVAGGGLALLTLTRALASPTMRLGAALALGAAVAAMLALAFPACLGDPYAHLDERLTILWLSNVNEARSIVSMLHDLPQEVLPYYGLAAIGIVAGLLRCVREPAERRWGWIACVAVLAMLTAVALWQVRGAAAANAVAAALVPAALVRWWPAPSGGSIYLGLSKRALIAALVVSPITLIAVGSMAARAVQAVAGRHGPVVISDGPGTCSGAADYAPLARLPKGLVLGFIDAGPFVLMETPHSVLAAPYHRNVKGNGAMLNLFLKAPGEAKARLAALGVDYVAFCPGAAERHNYAAAAPDGLVAALARGDVPDFLERIPLDGTNLAVYRVRR